MRIGERLIRDAIITSEQLDEGLHAQDLHGGRLGSALIELGYVDSDTLAECLGRHHGMPAVLDKHTDLFSAELQARLSPDLAAQWAAVPMAHLLGCDDKIAVAVMDPLPAEAIEQLRAELGGQVVLAIAPQRRLLDHIQRVYGVPGSGGEPPDSPPALAAPDEQDARCDIQIHIQGEDVDDAVLEDLTIDEMSDMSDMSDTSTAPGPAGTVEEPAEPSPPSPASVPAPGLSDPSGTAGASAADPAPDLPPASPPGDAADLQDMLRVMSRATGRERLGDLAIAAMRDGLDGILDAAVLLLVRDRVAVGWKGFVRGKENGVIEAAALPVKTPSVIYRSLETREPYVGPPPDDGAAVDRRLWSLLKTEPPPTVAVAPVVVDGHTVCLLYAHSFTPGLDLAGLGDSLAALAEVMGTAFTEGAEETEPSP